MTGYVDIPAGDEASLTLALSLNGPVSVALYTSSKFQFYSTGTFIDTGCARQANHAVSLWFI